jgi:hypothetical protein
MLETLHRYLDFDMDTEATLRPRLALLVGRPIFFYDDFMTALWGELQTKCQSSALALKTVLLDAADAANVKADQRLAGVIGSMWVTKPYTLRGGISSRSLCMQLYAALRMNGGKVELLAGAASVALREGLLVLPLPPTMAALEGIGAS